MINTEELTKAVRRYRERCRTANTQPTYKGMGIVLGVSSQTIGNVVHGTFNGRQYTERPAATRIIANSDFEIVQGLFNREGLGNE